MKKVVSKKTEIDFGVEIMPREKLRIKGPRWLSDEELMAILIGTGHKGSNVFKVAKNVLDEAGGLGKLSSLGAAQLAAFPGMGFAKASRLLAAVELGIRIAEISGKVASPGRFCCSEDIFERYRLRLSLLRKEIFLVVGLNTKNEVICEKTVAVGTVDECYVNPREVFRPLISEACAKAVVLHNHPSGDSTPSQDDINITRRLQDVGKLVGIPLLDHLVVGAGNYTSLRDKGIMLG